MIDSLPLHPLVIHFVVALIPLTILFLLASRISPDLAGLEKVAGWLLLAALPAAILSVVSGDYASDQIWKWTGTVAGARDALREHDEAAGWIPWLTALALIGWWGARLAKERWQFWLRLLFLIPALAVLLQVGHLGAQLVYRYNAAEAYQQLQPSATQHLDPKQHP